MCWVRTLNRAVLRIWVLHSAPTLLRILIPKTAPLFILTMSVEGTLPSVKILPQGSSFFRNLMHNVPLLRNSISTAVHFEVYFYWFFHWTRTSNRGVVLCPTCALCWALIPRMALFWSLPKPFNCCKWLHIIWSLHHFVSDVAV